MKVFNTCFKVVKRRAAVLLVYFVIFVALAVALSSFSAKQQNDVFHPSEISIAVVNEDGPSSLVNGLTDYLTQQADLVDLQPTQEAMQDALFYGAVDYILIIPHGFSEQFASGKDVKLDQSIYPNAASGVFAERLVNQYLQADRLYRNMLPDLSDEERAAAVEQDLLQQTPIEKSTFGSNVPVPLDVQVYFRMLSYILLVLIILATSTVMMVFNRADLKMRNLCSPMPTVRMNLQLALCSTIVGLGSWIVLVLTGLLIYRTELAEVDPRVILLCVGNSFLYAAVSLSIGFFVGLFVRNSNFQNVAANFISLSLGFIGGVFVPIQMLGDTMRTVAHFVPSYWYNTALERICGLTRFDWQSLQPIVLDQMVLLGFAAAIFVVALVVSRKKRQTSDGFAGRRTEFAA